MFIRLNIYIYYTDVWLWHWTGLFFYVINCLSGGLNPRVMHLLPEVRREISVLCESRLYDPLEL